MKKLLIPILALLIASPAWSAQQNISTITTKTSREALRTAVNTELGKVQSNTTELYSLAIAAPWLAQATAPSITNVFWVDTSGASPVIKYYDGDSWEVAASGEGGTYTLPVATSSVLGGVKQGDRVTIAADGTISANVQTTDISGKQDTLVSGTNIKSVNGSTLLGSGDLVIGEGGGISHATSDGNYYASRNGAWANISTVFPTIANTLVGDCTVGPCLDGTSDGGTLIKLYGPGGYWQALQAGNSVANRSWRLMIGAPPAAGTTTLLNVDEYGQMGQVATSTYLTPSGVGGALTVTATGFDGNLATIDNTLQEIAQKFDDYTGGSGVSLSAANTWTEEQTFSAGISTSEITSSAADGAHYLDVVNGVAISSTPTLGMIAYYNGRMRLADGTDWDGYFLEDTDASANGLSLIGAANYAAMRTLLDLEAGTDFNAYDADLADLADGSLTGSKVAGYSAATASKATTYTIGTDSASEAYGGTIYVTSATTITAPAIATGQNYCAVTVGDIAVSLDVNASDKMILDGVTLSDGDKATNTSKSGDTICCQYYSADGQYCWSGTVLGGHWTDGN